jgi:hypothetical protein
VAPWLMRRVLENISLNSRYQEPICSFFRRAASSWNHFSLHWASKLATGFSADRAMTTGATPDDVTNGARPTALLAASRPALARLHVGHPRLAKVA